MYTEICTDSRDEAIRVLSEHADHEYARIVIRRQSSGYRIEISTPEPQDDDDPTIS